MKKLFSLILLGAFVMAASVGCGDEKKDKKAPDVKKDEPKKDAKAN